jgi:hypothetical protein
MQLSSDADKLADVELAALTAMPRRRRGLFGSLAMWG